MSTELEGIVRLLLVDGDEAERLAVQGMLRSATSPLEVVQVVNAQAALERLRTDRFDCVLLDLQLPGHDGAWLLGQLRQAGEETPVVILTGHGDAQTAVDLIKAGATDFVAKGTLEPERLWQRIRQAVRIGRAEAEARTAREGQRSSESLLRLIVDSVPPLISYIDKDYRYRWNNRRYQDWFGEAFDEQGGQRVVDVVGEDAFAVVQPLMARALAGETLTYERQLPYRGGSRWVEGSYVPHVGANGEVQGLIALVQDIGERRKEETRRRRQAEFEQQLLGIVSHDLRNPISVISMNASMLLRREDGVPAVTRALARILSCADRAARMVRDLLDFTQARLGGGIPIVRRRVDLHEISRQMIDEAHTGFAERELQVEQTGDGRGSWDPDRLGQIVSNLVTNALGYSPQDTPVRVRTGPSPGQPGWVMLEVHNLGEPIPAEVLPTLFQPFKRGRDQEQRSQRSIGLGLYIVKHLVEAHDGRIEVISRPDEGTTFRVHLPRSDEILPTGI